MRLVLDSNVLIAAFIARGLCNEVLEFAVEFHEPQISEFVIAEVTRNLESKIKMPADLVAEHRRFLERRFDLCMPKPLDRRVCRDADDDNIIALAVESHSEVIVTGDPDLLVLGQYTSIKILNPRTFWQSHR